MKIRKISIREHLVLGNLDLDFTDKNGNIYDTVVFAGENGCGKTTLLSLLFDTLDINFSTYYNSNFLGAIGLTLNKDELNYIISQGRLRNIQLNAIENKANHIVFSRIPEHGNARIKWDISFYKQDELLLTLWNNSIFDMCKNMIKSYYQSSELSFNAPKISNITSMELDENKNSHIKSDSNFSREITQLLVDIDTNDARDVAHLADTNKIIPQDQKHKRIKRFNRAFEKVFENLSFNRVIAEDGEQKVLFSNYRQDVPLNKLSSGEKQIVFRGGFFLRDITNIAQQIAFVDEPELSLHPNWQKKILSYYREILTDGEQKAQLFVATHSPFIVHSKMENTKYIVFKRDTTGKIIVEDKATFPDFCDEKIIEEAFNIEWYKNTSEKILFVEDGAHKFILDELLKDKGFEITPIGSCDKVLACANALKGKHNFYFLVDGDRKPSLDTDRYSQRAHRLLKYCIENYLFDGDVFQKVLDSFNVKDTPVEYIKKVTDNFTPDNPKFDRVKTLIECKQFSLEKLDKTDCSELIKQLGRNEFLNKEQYSLIQLFIDKAKELGKFEELFSEVLEFLGLKND